MLSNQKLQFIYITNKSAMLTYMIIIIIITICYY